MVPDVRRKPLEAISTFADGFGSVGAEFDEQ